MLHCLILFEVFFLNFEVTCANLQYMIISIVQQKPRHWYLKTNDLTISLDRSSMRLGGPPDLFLPDLFLPIWRYMR